MLALRAVILALVLLALRETSLAIQEPVQAQSEPSCSVRGPLPDGACTPGAADPRVTQENIHETICLTGYSARMRPPVRMTNRWKRDRMAAYATTGDASLYEGDHLVSIEIGGDPGAFLDPTTGGWTETGWQVNIWAQEWDRPDGLDAHHKDHLENYLHREVCTGRMPLAQAQAEIATDWVAAYQRYVEPAP